MRHFEHNLALPVARMPMVTGIVVFMALIVLALIAPLQTERLYAQSLAAGQARYMKNDFKGAEDSLNKALPKEKRKGERAKILKLLGIVQYMQNKRTEAAGSFKNAIALDPNITLTEDETLDESVIPFFNQQRPKAPPPATKTSSRPAPPTPQGAVGKKGKTTTIAITCNVPTATVSIDGILAGNVTNPIETDPGKVELEITAAGYVPKKVRLNVIKDRENKIAVELRKVPPPKPKVKPRPPAAAPDRVAAQPPAARSAPGKKPGRKTGGDMFLPDPGTDSLTQDGSTSGRDLTAEFSMDAASGGATAGYAQPRQQAPSPYQMPPQQQQVPAQPYAQPAPYAQPMPYAAPPMMYPQPYYAAPTYMAPPPPPPPPVYDPYTPPPADSGPVGGYGPDSPASKPKKEKKGGSVVMRLLPFGIPQFYQGKWLLGLIFGGGQGAGIYIYMSNDQKASSTIDDTNKVLAERQKEQETKTGEEAEAYQAETAAFQAQRQSFVNKTRQTGSYGLYAFGGLYLASVIESFIFEPEPAPAKKKKRKYGANLELLPLEDPNKLAMLSYAIQKSEIEEVTYNISIDAKHLDSQASQHTISDANPNNGQQAPFSYSLGINWQF